MTRIDLPYRKKRIVPSPLPGKRGSYPLPLPASMLTNVRPVVLVGIYSLDSHDSTLFELDRLLKMQLQQESLVANTICFANVGYSPTPRQHF